MSFLVLFFALLIVASLWMASHQFISFSELWAICVSNIFGSSHDLAQATYFKPNFYLILKGFYLLPLDNWQHIIAARFLFGLIGVASLALVFRFCLIYYKSSLAAWVNLIFLLTCNVFFLHFFRVRSDVLVIFYSMLFLCLTIERGTHLSVLFSPILILTSFLIFASTPKSVYVLISLFVFSYFFIRGRKHSRKESLLLPLIHCLLPIFVVFIFSSLLLATDYSDPYGLALRYFHEAFADYFRIEKWQHIISLLKRSPFHILFIGLALFLTFRSQELREKWLPVAALSVSMILFILFHNEKWAFFIGTHITLVSLVVPTLFFMKKSHFIKSSILTLLLISPILLPRWAYWHSSNLTQKNMVHYLQDFTSDLKDPVIFDSVGILPRVKNNYAFIGPNDSPSQLYAVTSLRVQPPDLVLMTAKLRIIDKKIIQLLANNYQQFETGVWVRNDVFWRIKFRQKGLVAPLEYWFTHSREPID